MAPKSKAQELFAEELERIAQGGKGVTAIFKQLDDRLGKIKSTSGDIVDTLEDQLDIGQQLAENQKNIFTHKVNIKSLTQKVNKAESAAEKKIYQTMLDQAIVQMKTQKSASVALKNYQKTVKPIKSVVGMIPGIGSTLSEAMDKSGEAYEEGIGKGLSGAELQTKKLGAGFKVVGLAIAAYIGKNLLQSMQSMGAGLMDVLSRPEFIFFGEESRAIADEFGNMNESGMKLGFQMKMMAFFTGVTAENQAKIMGMMAATSDASLETLHSQMKSYKQAGVPFSAIMEDVANNTEFFAKFGKDGGANIFEAAKRAKELGINLGDVASMSDSLLDFESSIAKQMEASMLLGREINTDRARQLAFSGDQVGLQNEVLRLVGSEAEFNKMNFLQREALAGAVGLSVERMSALVREENSAAEAGKKNYIMFAGLGALLVGIAGAIIGALTLGTGVKKSLGGAVKGGLGGMAVGAGLGVGAAKMGNKVPGLQEGGIVATPMIANIAERGPEAVVPLPRDGMKVDMAQTNLLLERLIRKVDGIGVT